MKNAGQGRISPGVALFLLASILVSFLAASAAPTPLYGIYQERWHFSPITTTVVFAVYALAVLASLLTFGKLSDHVGRRPVLLVAIAIQMIALVVFVFAGGVPTLVAARVVQGLAAGVATAPSAPPCSTSTPHVARSRTRSPPASGPVPVPCCRRCSSSSSPRRPDWCTSSCSSSC
ncbi:MFS transporter [Micromonospora sp. 4G55]|uniref:MFS transporter n=1 Tax=Micromonospora sp. 4G55 TaxID=2806102 RepID=UPI001A4428B9|nr:MFS transporter [Micromonospora sp. 4G55]MBM0256386.1 MFS transporter [Micromonospora sp. 4G55]